MNVRVGHIPYLNMAPFHQGFGPEPFEKDGVRFEFLPMSPRTLGLEAEKGMIDAGAMSLVDSLRLSETYEPLETYGIGLKKAAQSVLVFSKKPLSELSGTVAVTDETSTSVRLLQVLLDIRFRRSDIHYGRIASSMLFDGEADALLLIGDEALNAKKEGIRGFPFVTDLGEEWYAWQGMPFVFARWTVRRTLPDSIKVLISNYIQTSLKSDRIGSNEEKDYWDGFAYELTPEHFKSADIFANLLEKTCLTA